MKNLKSSLVSTLVGLVVAFGFLYLTFKTTDLRGLWQHIAEIGLFQTCALFGFCLLMMLTRGVRWWYLFPRPLAKGELWAAQRALALCYGVNNIASRVGEVVRVLYLRRDTKRGFGSIASTVVADRLLFDFLMIASFFGLTLVLFREEILTHFPAMEQAFVVFLAGVVLGIGGLLFLALKPALFKNLSVRFRLTRIPVLGSRIENLIDQLSVGLGVVSRPGPFAAVFVANIGIWGLAVIYYWWVLRLFGIDPDFATLVLVFTVSSLGLLLPSPGGLGTVHYFMTIALTQYLGVAKTTAAATAAYCHGINYLALTVAAVVFFFWRPAAAAVEPEPAPS